MNNVVVGTYYIGWEQIELVLRDDVGGEFYVTPEKGCIPRIVIGADHDTWQEIVGILLHEAYEFIFERMRCRYSPADDLARDHSAYMFVISHVSFSEANARVSEFIIDALPNLKKAWIKWKKGNKLEDK
jgi:hypothetical protein